MDSNNSQPVVKKGPSGLSIAALVLSIFIAPVGFILALVDLFKKNGRNKVCSIIGLILSIINMIAGLLVILLFVGILGSGTAEYVEKTYVSQDMMMCDTIRSAITTAAMDPEVISQTYTGIPSDDEWYYVSNIDASSPFGKAVEEMMGCKLSTIDNEIKSSGNAFMYRFKAPNWVEVKIQGSDDGYGNEISVD